MVVSGEMLNMLFNGLPRWFHVDLVPETPEVMFAVKGCGYIVVHGWGKDVYCRLNR
jgi:hypothetical protein